MRAGDDDHRDQEHDEDRQPDGERARDPVAQTLAVPEPGRVVPQFSFEHVPPPSPTATSSVASPLQYGKRLPNRASMCNRGRRTAWSVLPRRQLPAASPSRLLSPGRAAALLRSALRSSASNADGVPAPRRGLTAIILRLGATWGPRLSRERTVGLTCFRGIDTIARWSSG